MDPYDRSKEPSPPPRPRLDLWRPVRQLAWAWVADFKRGSADWLFPWLAAHVFLSVWPAVVIIAKLRGVADYTAAQNEGWFAGFLALLFVFVVMALGARAWVRSAMRLDDPEYRDYWRNRFRL